MMRKHWMLAGAAVLIAVTATDGAVTMSSASQATQAAPEPRANTVKVQKGTLSATVSQDATLTYRARSDASNGSINQPSSVDPNSLHFPARPGTRQVPRRTNQISARASTQDLLTSDIYPTRADDGGVTAK